MLLVWNASGAFVPPTDGQLDRAVADPTQVAALVKDASVSQAAAVAREVIVRIVHAGLPPAQRLARISAVVQQVLAALPRESPALAAALGAAVAASPTASADPEVVSAIQQAVVVASGSLGSDAGAAFGNAYAMAMQSVSGAPGGGKSVPPAPPPPPVALPYEGQSLR